MTPGLPGKPCCEQPNDYFSDYSCWKNARMRSRLV